MAITYSTGQTLIDPTHTVRWGNAAEAAHSITAASALNASSGIANGFAAGGQAAAGIAQLCSTVFQYQALNSRLESQERIADSQYEFAKSMLTKEGKLMESVENINSEKMGVMEELAKTKKENAIAGARYAELKKTRKAAALNTRAILAKRNQAFYGTPTRAT